MRFNGFRSLTPPVGINRLAPWRRFALAILVIYALGPIPSLAGTENTFLNFAAVNQSQWGNGPGTIIDQSVNPTISGSIPATTFNLSPTGAFLTALGDLLDLPLGDLGSVSLSPSASFTAGLNASYHINGGTLDLNYPTNVQLSLPGQVKAGQAFTIGSGYPTTQSNEFSNFQAPISQLAATGGTGYSALAQGLGFNALSNYRMTSTFTSTFPYADAQAGVSLQASAGLQEQVCFILCATNTTDLGSINFNQQLVDVNTLKGIQVLGQNVVQFGQPVDLDGFATLTLNSPNVSVNGTLQGDKSLAGSASQSVLTAGFDLAQLIPLVGQVLDGEVAGFGYEIAKVEPQLSLGLYQTMNFQPNLEVMLQFNEPVLYNGAITRQVVAPVGQSLDITPAVVGSIGQELVVRPTYILNNTFENQTGISLSGDIDVDLLNLLDPIDQGPLFHTDLDLGTVDLPPIEDDQFTVNVGQITAGDINLGQIPQFTGQMGVQATGLTEADGNAEDDLLFNGQIVGTGELELIPYDDEPQSACQFFEASVCQQVFLADSDILFNGQDLGRVFCLFCPITESDFDATNPDLSADFGNIYLSDLSTYASIPTPDQIIASDPVFGPDTFYSDLSSTPAEASASPEPESLLLAGLGGVAIVWRVGTMRRKKKNHAEANFPQNIP